MYIHLEICYYVSDLIKIFILKFFKIQQSIKILILYKIVILLEFKNKCQHYLKNLV